MKKDVRKEITALSSNIGSVVSKADGTLQVCYYDNKESVKDIVTRYLSKNSLLECFVKIDFIECPKPEVTQCDLLQNNTKEVTAFLPALK